MSTKKTKTKAYQLAPAVCKGEYTFDQCFAQVKSGSLDGYIAEEKFDGLRYLLQFRPRGADQNFLTSRRVSKVTHEYVEKQDKVPFIRDFVAWQDTIMDGEFISEGISSDTQHAMAEGRGEFVVWDLIMYQGRYLTLQPLHVRRKLLETLSKTFPKWLTLVPQCKFPDRLLKYVISKGGEGIVLKDPNSEYGSGWYKVKGSMTADCVIVGYEMSTEGKYHENGWIKNIKLGQYVRSDKWKGTYIVEQHIAGVAYKLVEVGKTGGMTEKERAYITKNQKKLMYDCVEIEAQLRLPSGKFRHPRFKRFRHDKNTSDCIYVL